MVYLGVVKFVPFLLLPPLLQTPSKPYKLVLVHRCFLHHVSSRPTEPPRQTLTDPDVNLSIHPAPIDQPTVPQIANAQTGKAAV